MATHSSFPVGQVLGQDQATNVTGLPTASKVRVLDNSEWISTLTVYDQKGRAIWTKSDNPYLGTTDVVRTELDFVGRPLQRQVEHTKDGNPTISTTDTFAYDHAGRLVVQEQTLAGHTELLAHNQYDALGQLEAKQVGNTLGNPLQTVDYAYNVRGWLKSINDPANLGSDLFAFGINYNTVSHGGTALFNGNISETEWRTANTDNALKWYRYGYDALNRITGATDNTGKYNLSGVSYDRNGNIGTLQRKGWTSASPSLANNTGLGTMDDLVYSYLPNSNKLMKVADSASDAFGFVDDAVNTTDIVDDYDYDTNGNLIKDDNKGITFIDYNYLNLPIQVNFNGGVINYVYDAVGTKLKRTSSTGTETLYAGNFIYEGSVGNVELQFFPHDEGYVTPDGQGGYDYVYNYVDHLGSIRLSYTDANHDGSIDPVNHWCPVKK